MRIPNQSAGVRSSKAGHAEGGIGSFVKPSQFAVREARGSRVVGGFTVPGGQLEAVATCPKGQHLCCDGFTPPNCVCCGSLTT